MNSTNAIVLIVGMIAQWCTAAGAIWLTWWAAQSRDPLALRVVAMVLVAVPALAWPYLTLTMSTGAGSIASRAFMIGVVGAGAAFVRALFLLIWAIVSKDQAYLRVVGGVVAFMLVLGLAGQLLSSMARL